MFLSFFMRTVTCFSSIRAVTSNDSPGPGPAFNFFALGPPSTSVRAGRVAPRDSDPSMGQNPLVAPELDGCSLIRVSCTTGVGDKSTIVLMMISVNDDNEW